MNMPFEVEMRGMPFPGISRCSNSESPKVDRPPRLLRRSLSPQRQSQKEDVYSGYTGCPAISCNPVPNALFVTSNNHTKTQQIRWPPTASSRGATSKKSDDQLKSIGDMLDDILSDMKLTSQPVAATTIQACIRGTLARWNFQVLKLKRKVSDIQDLKEKQIRKIQQRKLHTMKALKQEQEYLQGHRVVRRRLRRVKTIRSHLQKEKIYALEEYHHLKEDCTAMTRDNDDTARVLQKIIDDIDRTQTNLNKLKANNAELQRQCQAYQTIVEVFPRLA